MFVGWVPTVGLDTGVGIRVIAQTKDPIDGGTHKIDGVAQDFCDFHGKNLHV
jgi:hypothetical protein